MVVRISADIRDANSETVTHAYDAELGYRVLFKEFGDKLASVANREEVASRTEVFLDHSRRQVKDQKKMSYDSTLERGGVFEEPG